MNTHKKKHGIFIAVLAMIAVIMSLYGCSAQKSVDLHGHKRMIGINIHNKFYEAYSEEYTDDYIKLSADMGSSIVRINYNPTDDEGVQYIKDIARKCHKRGMQVMLCLDDKEGTLDEISWRMKFTAENLAESIDYFQIFNETDIWSSMCDNGTYYNNITDSTGMNIDYYNPERLDICVEKVGAAISSFREAAPEAKIVINIGSRHYPVLDRYIEAGLSWDIIGFDIYELDAWDQAAFFKEMEDRYPGYDFMVTECNYPPNSGSFTDEKRATWLGKFLDIMEAYESDRMKAVIIYELMDQPNFEKDGGYDPEAHFGLVNVNEDYSPGDPKSSYFAVQKWILGDKAD